MKQQSLIAAMPTILALALSLANSPIAFAQPNGSVTQGFGTIEIESLLDCQNGRQSPVGTITATDGTVWTVPAETQYQTAVFATDLHNPCSGVTIPGSAALDLGSVPIIEVDPDGEIVTGYIFADNYFELYVNDTLIGVDAVPFTQFNSSVVRFRVSEPYSISTLLVDWEENLGLGSEANRGSDYHPGDAGFVASFQDESGEVVAITDESWKAQTYYIAPVNDLDCISEVDGEHLSASCSTADVADASDFYGVHYPQPDGWTSLNFDDSNWPNAYTYTNDTVGVDNKRSYTDFTDLFDDPNDDAQFIWSSNLVLDNLVLARTTIGELVCNPDTGGDIDGNGTVEFADFLILSGGFGQQVASHTEGDIDCNGTVEFADFLVLSGNFGQTIGAEAATVPEPNSLALLAMAGLVGLAGCRRNLRKLAKL